MSQLPIESVIPKLLSNIGSSSQVILKAQPGAGKSTFFPLQLIKQGVVKGKIVMLEPRRLAARNIAHYLADQLGENVGERIGFRVRGESKVSAKTQLEIVTEGVMTRMLQSDPELSGIDVVIFDEFHERSIHADTSLAFALEVQDALREDLKIVVMSATLDQKSLQNLLPEASYVECEGRGFPIEYRYAPLRVNDRLIPSLKREIETSLRNDQGSILVFLPSVGAIKRLEADLYDLPSDTDVHALYGRMSFKQQEQAIAVSRNGRRKVVLSTNIAETSLTIEGIRIVLDSGLERMARFDLRTGITKLEEGRIAQSSAIQRAGRAGRLEKGVCIRLYSEEVFKQSHPVPEPEILHSDLSSLCLELTQWGTTDVQELRWLDEPNAANLNQGFDLLKDLQLVSDSRLLTQLGKQAQILNIEPRHAAMLLKVSEKSPSYISTALALVAVLEEVTTDHTDLSYALHLLKLKKHRSQNQVERRSHQLAQKLDVRFSLSAVTEQEAGLCLSLAFPDRIAQLRKGQTGQFVLANGHGGFIDPLEALSTSEYIVAVNLMRSQHDSSKIFQAAHVDIDRLMALNWAPFKSIESVDWDEKRGQLAAEKQLKLGKLIVQRETLPTPEKDQMTQALLNYVRRKGLSSLNWNPANLALLERLRCGSEWLGELDWPDFSEQALLNNLELWLEPYLTGKVSVKSLHRIDLYKALLAYLGWPLNKDVDQLLPTHYLLPTGSKKQITYRVGAEPMVSVRMQEVFGEQASPTTAKGRKKIVLELLSPAHRPLQITSDLAGFWQGSYKEVQKEMKGRYPKHPWPDDPANHIATTKTKRQLK